MALSAAAASVIAAGIGAASGTANVIANNSINAKTREWNEKMLEMQNQWSLDQWNQTNEYNSPENQVARLYQAGLNPLYYGLDGSSAQAFESAQPLSWNPQAPNFNTFTNVGDAIQQIPIREKQLEQADANIKLAEAQIRNIEEDTKGVQLDNQFKEDTLDARERGVQLENAIKEENIKFTQKSREEVEENIKKIKAEVETEEERKFLVHNEALLAKANAEQVAALTPILEQYWKAKTQSEQAYAGYLGVQTAMQQGLLNSGWVDATMNDLNAQYEREIQQAKTEQERQKLIREQKNDQAIANAMKLGKVYDDDKFFGRFANRTIRAFSMTGEIIKPFTTVVSTAIGSTALIGSKKVSAQTPQVSAPNSKSRARGLK